MGVDDAASTADSFPWNDYLADVAWTLIKTEPVGWGDVQPNGLEKVDLYMKAKVVDGVGYGIFITDLEQIWRQVLSVDEWQATWRASNGVITITDQSLMEFLKNHLITPVSSFNSILNSETPSTEYIIEKKIESGDESLGFKIIDASVPQIGKLRWTLNLTIHPESTQIMSRHVILPLAGIARQRDRDISRLSNAVVERDGIITMLNKDIEDAGIIFTKKNRLSAPTLTATELKNPSPYDSNGDFFSGYGVSELYASPSWKQSTRSHFTIQRGIDRHTSPPPQAGGPADCFTPPQSYDLWRPDTQTQDGQSQLTASQSSTQSPSQLPSIEETASLQRLASCVGTAVEPSRKRSATSTSMPPPKKKKKKKKEVF